MSALPERRSVHRAALVGVLAIALVIFIGAVAQAEAAPFGMPHPTGGSTFQSGILGWIFAEQAAFYRSLSGMIRASKDDGTAVWGLLGISFLYGVFHAVGPGHGKAVISSYLVANEQTWRRGIILSFAAAAIQAGVAVIVVAIAAALLGATARAIGSTVHVVEIVSYSLVILIGARLLFVKGRGFLAAYRERRRQPQLHAVLVSSSNATRLLHRHIAGDLNCGHCRDAAHHHGFHCHEDHGSAWSHAHGPEPAELGGTHGWRRGLSAVVAVGLRPCSGAIIVLIFALAQNMFWTGIGATLVMGLGTAITVAAIATLAWTARHAASRIANAHAGLGLLAMRAIEVGASVLIVAFGALLLAGYMASEQLWMFTG
jgi:nickel/cobalt transporter (NicO) family protein